jgi:hypothetical protein
VLLNLPKIGGSLHERADLQNQQRRRRKCEAALGLSQETKRGAPDEPNAPLRQLE